MPDSAVTVAGAEPRRSASTGTWASQPSGQTWPPEIQRPRIRSTSIPWSAAQRQ